jgi:AraC family transcriptional regulator
MTDDLLLTRAANPGGEFSFTARGLYVTFHLGAHLALEQRTSDRLWTGRSLRGDVKVVLPGEQRTFRHSRPAEFAYMTIDTALLERFGLAPARLRPHVILRDAPLRHLMEALLAESAFGAPNRLFTESAAQTIVSRLLTLEGRPTAAPGHGLPPRALKQVLGLIEDRLEHNLSVLELSAACDISPSHFAALFKHSTGEAPHRYQIRRRVERARALLLNAASPAEAASAVGFCDQSHLSRHMRKLLGTSPATLWRLSSKRTGRKRNVL